MPTKSVDNSVDEKGGKVLDGAIRKDFSWVANFLTFEIIIFNHMVVVSVMLL